MRFGLTNAAVGLRKDVMTMKRCKSQKIELSQSPSQADLRRTAHDDLRTRFQQALKRRRQRLARLARTTFRPIYQAADPLEVIKRVDSLSEGPAETTVRPPSPNDFCRFRRPPASLTRAHRVMPRLETRFARERSTR